MEVSNNWILCFFFFCFTSTLSGQDQELFLEVKNVDEKVTILIKWGDQLQRKYPSLFYRHPEFRQLETRAPYLYEDEQFKPVFGKPFDQLTTSERKRIFKNIQKCYSDKVSGGKMTWRKQVLHLPFTEETRGALSYTAIRNHVQDARRKQQELADVLAQINSINPDVSNRKETLRAFDRLLSFRDRLPKSYRTRFTEEQRTLENVINRKARAIIATTRPDDQQVPTDKVALLNFHLDWMNKTSIYSYFSFGDLEQPSGYFNLKKDYQELREKRFRPSFAAEMQLRGKAEYASGRTPPSTLMMPIEDAEIDFRNHFVESLFYGDFDRLEKILNRLERSQAFGMRFYAEATGKLMEHAWLIMAYVHHADELCGNQQINETERIRYYLVETRYAPFSLPERDTTYKEWFWIDKRLKSILDINVELEGFSVIDAMKGSKPTDVLEISADVQALINKFGCQSRAVKQLVENCLRYDAHKKSIQQEYEYWQALRYDDRLFEAEVYERLKRYYTVPGKLISSDLEGRMISEEELSGIALNRFIQKAADLGIAEKDITRAMFEGRFNPAFEDLRLVNMGLCTGLEENQVPLSLVLQLKENGMMKPGETMPDNTYLAPVYNNIRNEKWVERFGDILSIPTIKTIMGGEEKECSGKDLALRLLFRVGDGSSHNGKPEEGILRYFENSEPGLRYMDAVQILKN